MPSDPEYFRQYYAKNKERRLAQCKEYASKHAEEKKAYLREYYKSNKHKYGRRTPEQRAKYNAKRRAEYAADPSLREKIRTQTKEWQSANPGKRKANRIKKYGLTKEQFDYILATQGHQCPICGFSDQSVPNDFPVVD